MLNWFPTLDDHIRHWTPRAEYILTIRGIRSMDWRSTRCKNLPFIGEKIIMKIAIIRAELSVWISQTLAHSSEKRHSRLFNFSNCTPCFWRKSLCAFRQAFSNSVNADVDADRRALSDCDRRIRWGVVAVDIGGVNEFPDIIETAFFATFMLSFTWFFVLTSGSLLLPLSPIFSVDMPNFGLPFVLIVVERRKRCAHGDFCASDSTISCFSVSTNVRSGLWPRYVWIVS